MCFINYIRKIKIKSSMHTLITGGNGMVGRYLKTLVDEVKMPGKYSVVWTPDKALSSGVYLLEMQYDTQMFIEKINFIK